VLVDTSVLAAAFSPRDGCHRMCRDALLNLPGQAFTTDAVLVELASLLRRDRRDFSRVLRAISQTKTLKILSIGQDEYRAIAGWLEKYADQQPDFADACLVYVAEREGIDTVFTLDSDFLVYRTLSGRQLEVGPRRPKTRTRP
jgi:hypothetical protein